MQQKQLSKGTQEQIDEEIRLFSENIKEVCLRFVNRTLGILQDEVKKEIKNDKNNNA